ncbi:MAG: DNA repair protein RecN [Candidatus Competibacterales bacterium]|nr:DNA repair protein RecN [Candidatus Competibacterales bacterium]
MLCHLQLRDFAIVDSLEIDFSAGLHALTGETGAGKSIVVDALGLLLGDRADSASVRPGAERAELAASFDLSEAGAARAWLAEHALEANSDCHLRRVINAGGRSRCYINGSSQPLSAVRELGNLLVDIHSQHEHQSLLRREVQRQLLDDYGAHAALLAETGTHYHHWRECTRRLETLEQAERDRDARLDLLRYQIGELEALAPTTAEPDELAREHQRLEHAGRLLEGCRDALAALYEADDSVHGRLGQWSSELQRLAALDDSLQPVVELLDSARIQLEEAGSALNQYGSGLDLDPAHLQQVSERLDSYYTLARKHRCEPGELDRVLDTLLAERDALADSEHQRERLRAERDRAREAYDQAATHLSRQRARAGARLGERISAAMQELGMQGGRFRVALAPRAAPSPQGQDEIEFEVSANPGQPPQPLARVASGGELSRISLAIQVIAADSARIPTLVFDEVDTGIGGGVAEVVGRRLRELGTTRQVLCVTHLPQVAAQAHAHYLISKSTDAGTTRTRLQRLDPEQRTEELARMLGGLRLTRRTLAHAREMLDQAQAGG